MPFKKNFLWGGATAANQCEGGYSEGGRGTANVDMAPWGEDRQSVITGRMKMLEFDDHHFYPAKMQSICITIIRKISVCLVKWDLKYIG